MTQTSTGRRLTSVPDVEMVSYGRPIQKVVFRHARLGWLVKFEMVPIVPGAGPNSLYSIDAVVRAPDRFSETDRALAAELQKRSLAGALRILSPRGDIQIQDRISTADDEEEQPDADERNERQGERTGAVGA